MEEILASIRKIIADDEALPLTRGDGDLRSSFTTPKPFETNIAAFAPKPPDLPMPDASAPVESRADMPAEPAAPSPQSLAFDAAVRETPSVGDPVVAHAQSNLPVATSRLDDADMQSFAEIAHELAAHDLRPAPADEPSVPDAQAEDDEAEDMTPEIVTEMSHRFEQRAASAYVAASGANFGATIVPAPDETLGMLSPESDASVSSAFRALSASVQLNNSEVIDRHVRDMLRPMLKQWLDDNLPVMVERLVRVEIERVARGGR